MTKLISPNDYPRLARQHDLARRYAWRAFRDTVAEVLHHVELTGDLPSARLSYVSTQMSIAEGVAVDRGYVRGGNGVRALTCKGRVWLREWGDAL